MFEKIIGKCVVNLHVFLLGHNCVVAVCAIRALSTPNGVEMSIRERQTKALKSTDLF